jgi:microcin C transport system permease protein
MPAYIARRILLMIPTLLGIMLISFTIVQFAPGGPVERIIAQLQGQDSGATSRISGGGGDFSGGAQSQAGGASDASSSRYRGAQGLDPQFIKQLETQFGFDKPAHERFLKMLWDYTRFDFGKSYFRDVSVLQLIKEKLPVSVTLGLWMTLLSYAISIPLGIKKAVRDGSAFDVWTSAVVIVGYAIPGFLFAILLIVLFAGGSFWQFFPLRGFLDEIRKQYVLTARMKGLNERQVLYGHVFRNAMLIVIAGFPGAFISAFFAGALLIETIFSLDGLGLLSFESIVNRDYPVVFANLYIFSLVGLLVNLVSDLTYTWIDPRIDFETRET